MKRYVKSSNEISLTAYHVSYQPVSCLTVENVRISDSLGIHFVLSKDDACAIAPQLICEGVAYVYRCNLVNLRCKDVRDCCWVSSELVREAFDFGTEGSCARSLYVDVMHGLFEYETQKQKAAYLRSALKRSGVNCLRYKNTVEQGLQNKCLCVVDNRCIQDIQLIESIKCN